MGKALQGTTLPRQIQRLLPGRLGPSGSNPAAPVFSQSDARNAGFGIFMPPSPIRPKQFRIDDAVRLY